MRFCVLSSRVARLIAACGLVASGGGVLAQQDAAKSKPDAPAAQRGPVTHEKTDLTKQPTLYVVAYAHLDTEWRWTYVQTIRQFVPDTMRNNFPLFEKYPSYVFNFSGSRRYQFMQEYYPADYAKVKEYVKQGRWFPCGSSVDENDANVPSAESQIRHVLYGNRFFRREFGVASDEFMLPDCFGFPYALPSILAHCGVKGFSTQKLTWGSAAGIPFKVGNWEGPDGRSVMAALDPGAYVGDVKENLANSDSWKTRIDANGKKSGVFVDYHYYGVGDQGGAPREPSVKMVEESVKTDGAIKVISSHADWMFQQITPEMQKTLPRYKGELLLTEHSAGSISSQAYMKRWNRSNEQLADAAERASVAAWWLQGMPASGAAAYPAKRLEDAWSLVLGSQMHDILPGTSVPKAYEYAWNDEVIAANEFADVAKHAVGVVASIMDTRGQGTTVVLYNPLSVARKDAVECSIKWSGQGGGGEAPTAVRVAGPDGKPVAAQFLSFENGVVKFLVLADLPALSFTSFDVMLGQIADAASQAAESVSQIENERCLVKIDAAGDVASIFDKSLKKELLSAPARLALTYEKPREWPAWNMDWNDRKQPPRSYVGEGATAKVTQTERGPVRTTLRVEREHEGSVYVQDISLVAGSSIVEFRNRIDWNTKERALKASFPLAAANPMATYDLQTGVIERDNNNPKRYENPAHMWMDLTDKSGEFGVSILNDSKYGSDKPDDHTLRLTMIYTPGVRGSYRDQGTQDIGRHDIRFALAGHAGDWRAGDANGGGTHALAARFNQPVHAFVVPQHEGKSKQFLLARCDSPSVIITAIKKAEDSDEVIVRLRETTGQDAKNVSIRFGFGVAEAREVDGQERPLGEAMVAESSLIADVHGYGLRAYAIKLVPSSVSVPATETFSLDVPFNTDVASTNANRIDGKMEGDLAYPAEQFPSGTYTLNGIPFAFGSTEDGKPNALACDGRRWSIRPGKFSRVEIIAAAASAKEIAAMFMVENIPVELKVQPWRGYAGQWDNRRWAKSVGEEEHSGGEMVGLDPGFIRPSPLAWYCTHHHTPTDDAHYMYSYLYRYTIELPEKASSVFLPKNPKVMIFAATAIGGDGAAKAFATAAAPLRDTFEDRAQTAVRISKAQSNASDAAFVSIAPTLYGGAGSIRYTTDGAAPTAGSKSYDKPIAVYTPTTITAAAFDSSGKPGPVSTMKIEASDASAPKMTAAHAVYASPAIRVEFSEPVDAESAAKAVNYEVLPAIAVSSAKLSDDARSVILTLAKPPETDLKYSLKVSNIADASPAKNAMKDDAIGFIASGPVYRLEAAGKEHVGATIRGIRNLPVGGAQPWTMNMFVRTDKQPPNRTVIAGFGRCEDSADGTARYLSKFGSGIHFWSRHCDVEGRTPLDLNKWQMLTVTYDGSTIRIYKDAKRIAEQAMTLSDDEAVINILPLDPWEKKRRFEGELREFTIWSAALTPDALAVVKESFKTP